MRELRFQIGETKGSLSFAISTTSAIVRDTFLLRMLPGTLTSSVAPQTIRSDSSNEFSGRSFFKGVQVRVLIRQRELWLKVSFLLPKTLLFQKRLSPSTQAVLNSVDTSKNSPTKLSLSSTRLNREASVSVQTDSQMKTKMPSWPSEQKLIQAILLKS